METSFGFGKPIELGFDAAIERVTGVLKSEGFRVLSDIDVNARLHRVLDAL